MDFIRDYEDTVPEADISDPFQFFPGPHTAYRIVRTAEEIQSDIVADDFLFQILKIDVITAAVKCQRTVDQPASETVDQIAERVVDRTVQQDAVPFFREGPDRCGKSEDDAGGLYHPAAVDGKSEMGVKPRGKGLKITVVCVSVAENPVFRPGVKRFDDGIRYAKIHIGYPQRQQVVRLSGSAGRRIFDGIAVSAVDDSIKTTEISAVFWCFSVHDQYLRILCICCVRSCIGRILAGTSPMKAL